MKHPLTSRHWLWLSMYLSAFLYFSCRDLFNSDDYELKKLKVNPTLNLPLLSGDLVVNDLLAKADQTNIKVDQDQVVFLLYEQTLKTSSVGSLIDFPSRTFNKTLILPPATLPAQTNEILYASLNTTEDFNFSPEKLTEIKLKNTSLRVVVSFSPANPASSVLEVRLRLPDFKLSNTPFQRRISASSSGTVISLADYVATLNNNTFQLGIDVIERPHSNTVTIANGTIVNVQLEFNTIDYQYVRGFFGDQTTVDIPEETINFEAFGNALNKANVSFADPKLSFTVSNDYGIPTRITFSPLEGQKDNGAKIPITLNPASPLQINSPTVLGQSATTNVAVTNAKQLIDFVPDKLFYKLSARINQGLTSGNNFLADTSKIRVKVKAEIPLYGRASNILLSDTIQADFEDVDDSNIESGSIITKVNNQLPLDAFIQLYLTNDQFIIYDSLFTPAQTAIVKASTVNAQGELQSPGVSDLKIDIERAKLDKLLNAKNIILRARLNTSKNSSGSPVDVKFKSTYKMNVIFSIQANLKLEVDL